MSFCETWNGTSCHKPLSLESRPGKVRHPGRHETDAMAKKNAGLVDFCNKLPAVSFDNE